MLYCSQLLLATPGRHNRDLAADLAGDCLWNFKDSPEL